VDPISHQNSRHARWLLAGSHQSKKKKKKKSKGEEEVEDKNEEEDAGPKKNSLTLDTIKISNHTNRQLLLL
jgi:hypothetical protein